MKLDIPKVVARVDLGEYAPEFNGQVFCIWLNPTLEILRKHNELVKGGDEAALNEWYAVMWSQAAEPETHWTGREVLDLQEKDPALLAWMIRETWDRRSEHISKKKKS